MNQMSQTEQLVKILSIGVFSGIVYISLELLFRGRTDITMFFLAFMVGIILMHLNDEFFEYTTPFEFQVLAGTLVSTCFEFIFGVMFNQNFEIWDYRNLPGTFLFGQLNILFVGIWALICMIGIPILDTLQWRFGLGQRPYYCFLATGNKKYYLFGKVVDNE